MMDLYSTFASFVKLLDPQSECHFLHRLTNATAPPEIKPSSFSYCENRTWQLLSIMNHHKDKSKICQASAIKQWICQVPVDKDLMDLVEEDLELQEEIEDMFRPSNTSSRKRKAGETEEIRKKRLVESTDPSGETAVKQQFITNDEKEAVYKKQYEKLRFNNFSPIDIKENNEPVHNFMYNLYCNYQKLALANAVSKINKNERSSWHETVVHDLKENSAGNYRIALYNVLAGNGDALEKSMCFTWEDTMWAYLNERLGSMLDFPEKQDTKPMLSLEITALAAKKDNVMKMDDPRIIFHLVQAGLISDTIKDTFKTIYLALTNQTVTKKVKPLYISDNIESRGQILRFLSTLIIYGCVYLGWEEDEYAMGILSEYSELNSKGEILRPAVIASYAAKLSQKNQVRIFSDFLKNFEGDDEECSILILLAKEHELNMEDILQTTHDKLFEKAIANMEVPEDPVDLLTCHASNEVTDNDHLIFRSIKWLLYDDSMCLQAFHMINKDIKYLLSIQKLHTVRKISEIIPSQLIDLIDIASRQNADALKDFREYQTNVAFATSIIDYHKFIEHQSRKPTDLGSYSDLKKLSFWQNESEEMAKRLVIEIDTVLTSEWLEGDEDSSIKELYVPSVIILYHRMLRLSSELIPSHIKTAKSLPVLLSGRKCLLDILKNAKKTEAVMDELSLSLTL